MRDARKLCLKMSKISKLCIEVDSLLCAHEVMYVISPRGGDFAHHQRKNSHSHFFWKCTLNLLTEKNKLQIVYILEFADGSRCALLFANRAHHA